MTGGGLWNHRQLVVWTGKRIVLGASSLTVVLLRFLRFRRLDGQGVVEVGDIVQEPHRDG